MSSFLRIQNTLFNKKYIISITMDPDDEIEVILTTAEIRGDSSNQKWIWTFLNTQDAKKFLDDIAIQLAQK